MIISVLLLLLIIIIIIIIIIPYNEFDISCADILLFEFLILFINNFKISLISFEFDENFY